MTTEQAIEAIAKGRLEMDRALWAGLKGDGWAPWEELDEEDREMWRETAREAVQALTTAHPGIAAILRGEAVSIPVLLPIEFAPKDRPILAWCDHEADSYVKDEKSGQLTLYAAHTESLSHAPTGWHIVEWGGGFSDIGEYGVVEAELPDWWFVAGSEFECAANPICWTELPASPPKLSISKQEKEGG